MNAQQPEPRRLARHIETPLSDARIERQWAALEAAGLPSGASHRARRAPWLWGGVLVAAAAAGAALLLLPGAEPATPERPLTDAGSVLQSEVEPVWMGLSDGSEVQLMPRTKVKVEAESADAVELSLEAGVARFDVTKRPGRRFSVRAGVVRVSVVGTRFELQRHDDRVDLRVQEGVVEVRAPGAEDARRVLAGERFVWDPAALPSQAEEVPEPEPEAEPEEAPAPKQPQERAERRRRPAPQPPSAAEIFERAHLARRSGRMAEAAEGYEQLVQEHADDARAGLAAFEAGRIRMDALGDPRGAIAAFERALAGGGAGSYREDALARIAFAHDALGDAAGCRKARERYLSRYPDGVHRAALVARCGGAGQ